jgi:TRAP-type mannitol/chloroaromatic compound transport system permease small subunit
MEQNTLEKPKICVVLDKFVYGIGTIISWLSVALVAAIILQVILRYGFGRGVVIIEELQWHFYGVLLIIAIPYTLIENKHIRLDVLHCRFSERKKYFVDFFGILFLLIPMILVIFDNALNVVADSWRVNEMSDSPLGLCCRWAFKSFMVIGMGLFGIAAVSRLIRMFALIKSGKDASGAACHVPPPAE